MCIDRYIYRPRLKVKRLAKKIGFGFALLCKLLKTKLLLSFRNPVLTLTLGVGVKAHFGIAEWKPFRGRHRMAQAVRPAPPWGDLNLGEVGKGRAETLLVTFFPSK